LIQILLTTGIALRGGAAAFSYYGDNGRLLRQVCASWHRCITHSDMGVYVSYG